MHKVFVYGTLLSKSVNPASRMVDAEVIGPAIAPGVIYDVAWFPGFKKDNHGPLVVGELIAVDDEGLERLDAYEGVPHLYQREEILVRDEEGKDHLAYVYVYNATPHPEDLIPSGDFIAHTMENV